MPAASHSAFGEGFIAPVSHTVIRDASADYHSLYGEIRLTGCDIFAMESDDKNGGPNHLQAWRVFRGLTQSELAELVGTNQNMIYYLETGERALSAKWLRRLAPVLDTTPGMILDHDPRELDSDVIDIWSVASVRQKRQISEIAKTIVRTGTDD